jgi:RNA polymerase sigma factor (sigma-70 family)
MNLYIQGDIKAFGEIYVRHKSKVYSFLLKRLPSSSLADEVFQASFLKLHQSRLSYSKGEPFLPWLFTIARNTLFDHLRKSQSEKRKLDAFERHFELMSGSAEPDQDSINLLEQGLGPLSQPQRDLLNQRYIEGLDFEEIARRIDSTPVAVRQSISRIMRKLKKHLRGSSS